MLRKLLFICYFILFLNAHAFADPVVISLDTKMYESLLAKDLKVEEFSRFNDISLIQIPEKDLEFVSSVAHEEFRKCGGFILEDNLFTAASFLSQPRSIAPVFTLKASPKSEKIAELIEQVDHEKMREVIYKLSSFQNRYYRSSYGVSSQDWLFNYWKGLANGRTDVKVEKVIHSRFDQPSVVLTIEGTDKKAEIVVLGGHGDSIEGWSSNQHMKAPGADDNASGIATLTEILRLILSSGHKPKRTIQFMSYAAEEVGLRGSQDIAARYSRAGKDVKAVIQFDMTNFDSSDYDIVFITDYTSSSMTEYLITLINNYLPNFKYGSDRCGYACSDHASWYRYNYPVAFPFESTFSAHNRKIHTRKDTLDISGGHAKHASKFAKLGVAFAMDAGE